MVKYLPGVRIIICSCFILMAFPERAGCQSYFYNDQFYEKDILYEFGMGVGGMNCLTDIGGNKGMGTKFVKDINWKNTQFCSSVYFGANFHDVFGLRLEGTFGHVRASDSVLGKYKTDPLTMGRYSRNLSFRSHIKEISLVGEFHPLMLRDYSEGNPPLFSPYILAGIGTFTFSPQTFYQGRWIDLEPLHLEGQGFKEYRDRDQYATRAISYPMGLGVRYEIGALFVARLEFCQRFTNTDYIDDVSKGAYVDPSLFAKYLTPAQTALATQLYDRHREINASYFPNPNDIRGKSDNTDSYFTFNLKLGLVLGRPTR